MDFKLSRRRFAGTALAATIGLPLSRWCSRWEVLEGEYSIGFNGHTFPPITIKAYTNGRIAAKWGKADCQITPDRGWLKVACIDGDSRLETRVRRPEPNTLDIDWVLMRKGRFDAFNRHTDGFMVFDDFSNHYQGPLPWNRSPFTVDDAVDGVIRLV